MHTTYNEHKYDKEHPKTSRIVIIPFFIVIPAFLFVIPAQAGTSLFRPDTSIPLLIKKGYGTACRGVVAPASPIVRAHSHYPTTFSGPPLRQRRGLLVCGGNEEIPCQARDDDSRGGNEEIPAFAGMTNKKSGMTTKNGCSCNRFY